MEKEANSKIINQEKGVLKDGVKDVFINMISSIRDITKGSRDICANEIKENNKSRDVAIKNIEDENCSDEVKMKCFDTINNVSNNNKEIHNNYLKFAGKTIGFITALGLGLLENKTGIIRKTFKK